MSADNGETFDFLAMWDEASKPKSVQAAPFYDAFDKAPRPNGTTVPRPGWPGAAPIDAAPYVRAALEDECATVAGAAPRTRNDTINISAMKLGQLVGAGLLDEQLVVEQLTAAALTAYQGVHDRRVPGTIQSGLSKGKSEPRQIPERPDPPAVTVLETVPVTVVEEVPGEALPLPTLDLRRLDSPLPEPDWLVPGRIVRRSLTVLGAKPGVGKSWVAQDLSVALCAGRPWLGYEVPSGFRVLYIDAENGDDVALERLQRLGARSDTLGGRLHYTTASLTLPVGPGLARLRATTEMHRPDLVVIDTLASVAPTAEKDTESSSAFLTAVWHMARDSGAAVVLLHHLRKSLQGASRDDPLDAFRGAGHLIGAAHRAWVLDPIAPGEPKFVLRDVKARRGKRTDSLRIHVTDTGPDNTALEVVGSVEQVEDGYDAFLAAVLAYLRAKPAHVAATRELLHLPQAGAERTAKDYLSRGRATGVLQQPRRGHWTTASDQIPSGEDES
jgi:hypothetical protein